MRAFRLSTGNCANPEKENIMSNKISHSVKQALRDKYAWPGGYPLYLVMTDGGALCIDCAKAEYHNIADSTVKGINDGWNAAAADINWEDSDLTCDHCNKPIESAYGDDKPKYTFENDAILLLSDTRGQYIPRDFAGEIIRANVTGVSDEEWAILESGPEHEWYWDTWNDVEQNARVTDPKSSIVYTVYQNGDCFLVPVDCDIPEW